MDEIKDPAQKVWNSLSLNQMMDLAQKFKIMDYSVVMKDRQLRNHLLNAFKPKERRMLKRREK